MPIKIQHKNIHVPYTKFGWRKLNKASAVSKANSSNKLKIEMLKFTLNKTQHSNAETFGFDSASSELCRKERSSYCERKNNEAAPSTKEQENRQFSSMDSRIHEFQRPKQSANSLLKMFDSCLIIQEIKARFVKEVELKRSAMKSGYVTGLVRVFEKQRRTSHAIRRQGRSVRFYLETFTLEDLKKELHRRLEVESEIQKKNTLQRKGSEKDGKQKDEDLIPTIKILECEKTPKSVDEKESWKTSWNTNTPARKLLQVPVESWKLSDIEKYENEIYNENNNNVDIDNVNNNIEHITTHLREEKYCRFINELLSMKNCLQGIENDFHDLGVRTKCIRENLLVLRRERDLNNNT